MISWIVRRRVEGGHAKQNRGDFEGVVRVFSHDAVFEFCGEILRIAWGKVTEDRILVDLGVVQRAGTDRKWPKLLGGARLTGDPARSWPQRVTLENMSALTGAPV